MADEGEIEQSAPDPNELEPPGLVRADPDTGAQSRRRGLVLRVWIALQELRGLIGNEERHKRLHGRLIGLLAVSFLLDVVVTSLLSLFDSFSDNGSRSFPRAFAWTTSQMLVGGSSYTTPTGSGHVLEVLLQVYGIIVIAAIAGSFATFFLSSDDTK